MLQIYAKTLQKKVVTVRGGISMVRGESKKEEKKGLTLRTTDK